ncbi:hypothetical protein C0J52_05671 [Blattella germanica]|nr:hypothetical protein C0J52_05671 [Blattella germanica]
MFTFVGKQTVCHDARVILYRLIVNMKKKYSQPHVREVLHMIFLDGANALAFWRL